MVEVIPSHEAKVLEEDDFPQRLKLFWVCLDIG